MTTTETTCAQCGRKLYLIADQWSDSTRTTMSGRAFVADQICGGDGMFWHKPTDTDN